MTVAFRRYAYDFVEEDGHAVLSARQQWSSSETVPEWLVISTEGPTI